MDFTQNDIFYPIEIPYGKLAQLGISNEMLAALPKDVYDSILRGRISPRIVLKHETDRGVIYTAPAKFFLQRTPTGEVEAFFLPTIDKLNAEYAYNMLGTLSQEKKEELEKGLAVVTYLQIENEEGKLDAVRSFVQYDKELQQIYHVPTQVIGRNVKAAASAYGLSLDDIDALLEGKRITVSMVNKNTGETEDVTIGIDVFSECSILSVIGTEEDWLRISNPKIPKYSFGSNGCWVDTDEGLQFIEEKDFTEEIRSMLSHEESEKHSDEQQESQNIENKDDIEETAERIQTIQR